MKDYIDYQGCWQQLKKLMEDMDPYAALMNPGMKKPDNTILNMMENIEKLHRVEIPLVDEERH